MPIPDPEKAATSGASQASVKIEYRYVFDSGYMVLPISGVTGALMPTDPRNVFASFWVEHMALPKDSTATIEGNQIQIEQAKGEEPTVVTRRVLASLVINSQLARSLAKWLVDRANESDTVLAQGPPKGGHA